MGPSGTRSFYFCRSMAEALPLHLSSPAEGLVEPRLIEDSGLALRVRTDRRAGTSRPRLETSAGENLRDGGSNGANHGGAARRRHDDRRLRTRQRRSFAGVRRRRDHVAGVASRGFIARHRPPAGARVGFRACGRSRGAHRIGDGDQWPQALSRLDRCGGAGAGRSGGARSACRRR